MKRFLVKTVATATQENPNFAGAVHEYLYGKEQKLVAASGDPWINQEAYPAMIRDYGFSRECDARRSWIYKNPENSKYWRTEVEIIAVEV